MSGDSRIPTFNCENGVLTIASLPAQIRIQWMPQPLAEHKLPGSTKWAPFWPAFRLLRPGAEPAAPAVGIGELVVPARSDDQVMAKEKAFQAFRGQIPDELAELAAPFRSHQWHLLCLMHTAPNVLDLVKANPVLGYCLANSAEFRGTTEDVAAVQAVWYGHRKQKVILEWLGFAASESLVRLLRKIPPDAVYPSLMRRLRSILRRDSNILALIVHLPRITRGVLELVTNEATAGLVTPKLLHEVAGREDELSVEQISDVLMGALHLQQEMGQSEMPGSFTSIAQIMRFQAGMDAEYPLFIARKEAAMLAAHEAKLAAQRARRATARAAAVETRRVRALLEEKLWRPFPKPPLSGTAFIIPLSSAKELKEEGAGQRNCVAKYDRFVKDGHTYVYKVLYPERATLAIVRAPDGFWRLSELKGAGNRAVGRATVNAVEEWLNQHRLSFE